LLDFAIDGEFTPEQPQEQRDQSAAGQQQLDQQVRGQAAGVLNELSHARSFAPRHSTMISDWRVRVTCETQGALEYFGAIASGYSRNKPD
jgi:hypothetical protein